MKNILNLLLIASAFVSASMSIRAAESPGLIDDLKPLTPYLGEWKMYWTDLNGQHMSGKATLTAEAGGAIIIFKTDLVGAEGKPLFSRVSVFFWNSESKSIAESNFDSNGWHGGNVLTKATATKWVWQGHGYSGEAKEGRSLTEMIKVDENRWTAQFTKQVYNGQSFPDSPKFTFTRSK
ncbi:MAG TPA: hypothetical protein VK633_08325 [Verrucomicrobiae bacterium]|nr:hypothetical protein [Verrucomicrobiae bacterium]